MIGFVFQKIWSKKWMFLSLLLGNLLIVAIAAAGPMYSQASLQRALTRSLSDYLVETDKHPGTISLSSSYSSRVNINEETFNKVLDAGKLFAQMTDELNVPPLLEVTHYSKSGVSANHEIQADDDKSLNLKLSGYSGVEDHIKIINGKMFSSEITDNTIDIVVNELTFMTQKLILGEVLEIPRVTDASGEPYRLRVVGIFDVNNTSDPYWLNSPALWSRVCLMNFDVFREIFVNPDKMDQSFEAQWYTVLDYTKIRSDSAEDYLQITKHYGDRFDSLKTDSFNVYFQKTLASFLPEFDKLNTTIVVLLMPIFVLLAAFVFMVSQQMLEMEQGEIAIFKSRGAGKWQIILIYLLQSLCVAALSLAGGIPLGLLMCSMLGASNAFLEFVQRAALPLEINSTVWLFAIAAALFSVCTMVLPVFRHANVSIVAHKRQKNRTKKQPLWQMLFLDVILLGVSVYGLYQYNGQKEHLAQKVLDGASLDPLLYICSSVFMIGSALLILRIFPWIVRLIFAIGKRWWSPSLYTSFLRIIRTKGNQGFLMVFLILTVAMGIYNAQTARTINSNAQEKIEYINGADLVLQEKWADNSEDYQAQGVDLVYTEPDYQKYLSMKGIQSVTKVLVDEKISVTIDDGKLKNAVLMGINTKEFGQTAWFKEDLLTYHHHEYLNAMSQNSVAILVSSNFQEKYDYELGDVLNYTGSNGRSTRGIIYGFVDYWPGYAPVTLTKGSDGVYKESEHFLIVAHLAQIQANWGITPYQVWIDAEDSTQFIYDYAEETGTRFALFKDASKQLIDLKNDPIFQGTNGILTIGFICILLLCTMGFLIYWILSIQSRTLQFGIFRAMGMAMREIFTMLINEQLFITGVSLGMGIVVGILTSKLFVPLVQIAYSSADQVLPLVIISESSDYVRLFAVIGTVILLCMVALGVLISRIKISQALKLGED